MEFLTYIFTSLIVYFGLILGGITAYMARDELKQGKKYFILMQNFILALIAAFLLYFFSISIYFMIVASLIVFFALFLIEKSWKSYFIYPLLAVIFYLSSKSLNLFMLESTLIFLYGFPTAALFVKKKKDILICSLRHISFIIISILPSILISF